ncbi:MAG: hypothetical protein CME60_01680 [Halobacteriovoraceae bacterium]|nr:hypothetical protein [Halobacteriovoraceae bacterium]
MSSPFLVIAVDDEPAILEYYSYIIPDEFEVVEFTNPLEAISFAKANLNRLALIISDYKMPEMTGFEFRQSLLEQGIDCPFSLVTAFYDKEMATEGMRLKIGRFLEKPVQDQQILDLLATEAKERIDSLNEDREMISEFLQETKPMLEEIEDLILYVEEDPHDIKSINTYFRLLHTIKGTSSCLGLLEISEYAHKYEDLITKVKDAVIVVNQKVIDVLLEGLDQLKNLYQIAENFQPFPTNLDELAKIFEADFSDDPVKVNTALEDNLSASSSEEASKGERVTKEKDEKITVSETLLADFLEMSGELTVIRNTIFKSLTRLQGKLSGDRDLEHLSESMGELSKVSTILQNQISEMKKVELESVYRPMKRVVRDSCKVLDKNVEFEVKGDSFKIDTSVAKLLNGVLVHMLRNGVDHGIESSEERRALGKPEQGKLSLNSYETGENIIVEVEDDGKGLDKEFLKKKALEKELYSEEELEKMSDQRIYSIIFESGFSTNTEVTSVSGRGVGMDMVKSSISEFGGKILIDSKIGQGSKFVLVIPIPRSILIIKSLMVTSENSHFNIPLDDVDEVVLLDHSKNKKDIHELNGAIMLRHHGSLCPLVHLGHTLGLSQRNELSDIQNVVIVRGEGYRYGLLVDEINDIEEIVVKKLSKHFETQEYLGTTFSDDGALSLILDCDGVASRHGIQNYVDASDQIDEERLYIHHQDEENQRAQEFMRFSLNSLENCALSLDHVFRLEEVKMSSVQYTGNRALIRYRGKSLPLVYVEHELGLTDNTLEQVISSHTDDVMNVLVVNIKNKLYGAIIKELQDIATTEETVDRVFSDRDGVLGTITIEDRIVTVLNFEELVVPKKRGHLSFSNLDQKNEKAA